jgi:hypothetical protein
MLSREQVTTNLIEIGTAQFLTSFEHLHEDVRDELSVFRHKIDRVTTLTIRDSKKNNIGEVKGELETVAGNSIFYAFSSDNWTSIRYNYNNKKYIPHAVGATIAHLLISSIIDVWHSSPRLSLSEYARSMYGEYLPKQEGLTVTIPASIRDSYVIMRKTLD